MIHKTDGTGNDARPDRRSTQDHGDAACPCPSGQFDPAWCRVCSRSPQNQTKEQQQ